MKNIKRKILSLIEKEGPIIFIDLLALLKKENANIDVKTVKYSLIDLDEQGLIEERHFADGKVDYQLEHKEYELLHNQTMFKKNLLNALLF